MVRAGALLTPPSSAWRLHIVCSTCACRISPTTASRSSWLSAFNDREDALIYGDWFLSLTIVGSNYGPYVFLAQIPALLILWTMAASKFVGVFCALGLSSRRISRFDIIDRLRTRSRHARS